jgi:hypothetical protein
MPWRKCPQRPGLIVVRMHLLDSINQTDGVDHIRSKETVSRWYLTFRRSNDAFPNPHVHSTNTSLPPLLDPRYPELAKCIVQYAKQNLNELSAELLYSYLHEIALPALLEERRAELVSLIDNNHNRIACICCFSCFVGLLAAFRLGSRIQKLRIFVK